MKPERYKFYRAKVCMRREGRFSFIKPGLEGLDGQIITVETAWLIDDREPYLGEYAMASKDLAPWDLVWIASGDLELLEELPRPRPVDPSVS